MASLFSLRSEQCVGATLLYLCRHLPRTCVGWLQLVHFSVGLHVCLLVQQASQDGPVTPVEYVHELQGMDFSNPDALSENHHGTIDKLRVSLSTNGLRWAPQCSGRVHSVNVFSNECTPFLMTYRKTSFNCVDKNAFRHLTYIGFSIIASA